MSLQDSQRYLSARDAAALVGYTPDYVTRLAREGKVVAEKEGRQWFVERDSLKLFTLEVEAEKRVRSEELRAERRSERCRTLRKEQVEVLVSEIDNGGLFAFLQTVAIAVCLFVGVQVVWFAVESDIDTTALAAGVEKLGQQMSAAVITPLRRNKTVIPEATGGAGSESNDVLSSGVYIDPVSSDDPNFSGVILSTEQRGGSRAAMIDRTFADDVEVEFEDDGTGVLTPVFRDGAGEEYRILLVPEEGNESGS